MDFHKSRVPCGTSLRKSASRPSTGRLRFGQQFPMAQTGHDISEGWDLQAGDRGISSAMCGWSLNGHNTGPYTMYASDYSTGPFPNLCRFVDSTLGQLRYDCKGALRGGRETCLVPPLPSTARIALCSLSATAAARLPRWPCRTCCNWIVQSCCFQVGRLPRLTGVCLGRCIAEVWIGLRVAPPIILPAGTCFRLTSRASLLKLFSGTGLWNLRTSPVRLGTFQRFPALFSSRASLPLQLKDPPSKGEE